MPNEREPIGTIKHSKVSASLQDPTRDKSYPGAESHLQLWKAIALGVLKQISFA